MPQRASEPLVIGLMYPTDWETRVPGLLAKDLDMLAALDPHIELVQAPYLEPGELRTRRGADPTADLRSLAPPLTAAQREAFSRVEVALAMDLPFDVATIAPRLRWVQGMGAGVSQLVSAGLGAAGVRLTTASGVNAVSISEFVIARLLQMWKRLPETDALMAARRWEPTYGREIAGLTVGVVGFGAIGRAVAVRARAMGLLVVGQRRTARPGDTDPDVDQLYGLDGLHDMIARCDAIVSAVPETAETIGLFGAKAFDLMPPGALFVNVGRGSAVDEQALAAALRSGQLAGAAIDVAREEPLPPTSPLWDVPRLLISPHSATAPDQFWANVHALFRDNVQRYLTGQPLRNEVDAHVGG